MEKGTTIPLWSSPRSGRWRKGGSSAVLVLKDSMALGKLGSKWGREKRGPKVVWRRHAARGAFYRADEGELGHQRGGGLRRNSCPLRILIWGIQERKWAVDTRGSVGGGVTWRGQWRLGVAEGGTRWQLAVVIWGRENNRKTLRM
jgi:hypothetical protein